MAKQLFGRCESSALNSDHGFVRAALPSRFTFDPYFRSGGTYRMKRIILTTIACLTFGTLASLGAQDLTITNARIIVANGSVIERGSIVVRGGKNRFRRRRSPCRAAGTDHRRQRHDRHAGIHRCAPAHQYRTQREGADAGAARSRLHDDPFRRRSGGRKHHAAGSHRKGVDQRAAHHPFRIRAADNNTPEMARAEIRKMAEHGNQVYWRDSR